MKSLSLFINQDDILRVGGRLENSDYSYDKKHPYLVPAKSKIFPNMGSTCAPKVFSCIKIHCYVLHSRYFLASAWVESHSEVCTIRFYNV